MFSVSELTAAIRGVLETGLGDVWVEGEISNCRTWNTGHVYFTLKDEAAQIKAVTESGLDPRWLEVELTESVMMGDSASARSQLAELRALGVSLSLDDFGTGYCSLGYLSRFSLDKLKIDQGFVRDIITDPRSAAIARATIALANGLSLGLVAEGGETGAQRDFLGDAGCAIHQGYLYSRPLPVEAMAALLGSGRAPG